MSVVTEFIPERLPAAEAVAQPSCARSEKREEGEMKWSCSQKLDLQVNFRGSFRGISVRFLLDSDVNSQ